MSNFLGSFQFTVAPVNDTPTINGYETNGTKLRDTVTIEEDTSTDSVVPEGIAFTIGDEESNASELTVTATSNNKTVVPETPSNIILGGSGNNRTLKLVPAENQSGTAIITLRVSDGSSTRTAYVTVVVTPVNDAPMVTPPNDTEKLTIPEDGATEILYYTISDIDSDVTTITMTASSSNDSIVKPENIVLSGNGAERTVQITPEADACGDVTITLQADDGGAVNRYGIGSFVLHVTAVNDSPVIATIPDQATNEDHPIFNVPLPVSDIDSDISTITYSAISGNTSLIDSSGVTFDTDPNNGMPRMTLTPKANQNGEALITVKATDSVPVNDHPSFTAGGDVTVNEDCGTYSVDWAKALLKGPSNENGQTLTFLVSSTNDDLFEAGKKPAIAQDGTLTFTPATDAFGTSTVTVYLKDDGGTADGGIDQTACAVTFTITVNSVNDSPSFTAGGDVTVNEDCGTYSVDWTSDILKGPNNENSQTLTFLVSSTNNDLFEAGKKTAIAQDGTLTFTPATDAFGSSTVTVYLKDDGRTANGGIDQTACAVTFTITVNSVNDAPTFAVPTNVTVLEDSHDYDSPLAFATGISTGGGSDEANQPLIFTLSDYDTSLFSAAPSMTTDGKLSFTLAADANGSTSVNVKLTDGTNMVTDSFTITVTKVNDAPDFDVGENKTVGENTGEHSYRGWAQNPSVGPANENTQIPTFTVTTNNNDLFEPGKTPTISADGTLTFTPKANVSATEAVIVSVTMNDLGGIADGGTETSTTKTFTITVVDSNDLTLDGTICDAETGQPINGASVKLLDMDGNTLTEVATEADGTYSINPVSTTTYTLLVSAPSYNDNSRVTTVSFANSTAGIVTENFLLADFELTLSADPEAILGDGIKSATLTATVKDKTKAPISGVTLTFYSEKGTFAEGVFTATTDADGTASVTYVSENLSGVDQVIVPVTVSVDNSSRKLYGTATIMEYFVPGFVEGVVRDGISNEPVEGATVTVSKDFDGDGIIDFTSTQITRADGVYKIAIPRGNINYDISITKPVMVGGVPRNITATQSVSAGSVGGGGTCAFNPIISATGIVVEAKSDGSESLITDLTASDMKLQIIDSSGTAHPLTIDSNTGVFQSRGLTVGKSYELQVVHTFSNNTNLVVGHSTITISADGEMNISQVLIDPYGTTTDSATGKVISDANVQLYYANTPTNIASGIKPDTLVALPALANFPPANNANPQDSDSNGKYAFMVFPHTDYYIVATKSGYQNFKSETISVGTAIVNYDFQMIKNSSSSSSSSNLNADVTLATESDVALVIESDATKLEEGKDLGFTVKYSNKSNAALNRATVTVTVPTEMTVKDSAGGTVIGNKIVWKVGPLTPNLLQSLSFTLTATTLTEKETTVTISSEITSETTRSSIRKTINQQSRYCSILTVSPVCTNAISKAMWTVPLRQNAISPEPKPLQAFPAS